MRAAKQGGCVGGSSHVEATVSPHVGRLSPRTGRNTRRVEGILSLGNELDNALKKEEERPSMRKQLDVIYENGVFRPLEPVDMPEHQRLTIMISEISMVPAEEELLDTVYERWAAAQVKEDVSLEAVRQALSKIP